MTSFRITLPFILFTSIFFSCHQQPNESSFAELQEEPQYLMQEAISSEAFSVTINDGDINGFIDAGNNSSKLIAGNYTPPPPPPPQLPKKNQSPQKETSKKKIIKTASLKLEVEKYAEARKSLDIFLDKNGAYISSEFEQNTTYVIQNTLTIRVSPENLDGLIANLEGVAKKVNHKHINVRDVTKEFLDLEIRIKTKREVIDRYRVLLKQAKNVKEILAVEEELRAVIEEVESKEGQLKYLRDQVGLSTINLTIIENLETPTNKKGFFVKLGNAFGNGWSSFLSFTVGMISIWPFLLIIGLVIFLIRRFRSKRKTS